MKKTYPGTLFLVIGNSGSGKDSIISGAVKRFPSNLKQIHVAKRYITRPPSEYEENYSISEEKFNQFKKEGKFALSWHIYHLSYGVPVEIDEWLNNGESVIVNVSRTIIDDARELYDNIKVIFIEVPFEITLERVKSRGREAGNLLDERIERARTHQKSSKADHVVNNSGDLDDAIDQFLNIVIKSVE